MQSIKIGIIGAGFIAQQSHIPNYLNNPSAKIIGIADLDKYKLNEVKEKFGIRNTFTDYKKLFKMGVDAVSICTPTSSHSKFTIEAAENGIHVLCEKPMALTLNEANEMISVCKKNNIKFMMGFNYRFIENHKKTKKMIEKGDIGKPFFVHGQFASSGPYSDIKKTGKSFYFDAKKGGGVLYDSGSHLIDLLMWFFGDVASLSAKGTTYMDGIKADDVASVSLKFKNNIVGTITVMWTLVNNWSGMGDESFVKVIGEEGKIVSDFFGPSLKYFNEKSKICRVKGIIQLTPKKFDPKMPFEALNKSWQEEIDQFVRCISKDKTPPITEQDGKRALEVVLKAYQSMGEH